ncbi:MAG: leucine-rich repeat protein [Eubacteriales bacterium]|nr:leucine-rich repeat protein [Eubacteriales bacterium]
MDDKKIKKTVRNASITLAVTAGAAIGIAGYTSGKGFIPSLSDREFNFNQVHFSGDNDIVGQENNSDDDSRIIEKDNNSQNNEPGGNNSGYLFDGRLLDPTQPGNAFNIISSRQDDGNISDGIDNPGGQIFDIVGNGENSDVIIAGGLGNGGAGTNSSGNSGTGGAGDNQDNNDGQDRENDISQTAKDPEIEKPRPGISSSFDSKPYDEGSVTESPDNIMRVVIKADESLDANMLYKGQSIDAYTIFCALDTYIIKKEDGNPVVYLWGKESYDRYIRISSVSFDGGQTWTNDYPVAIPYDLNEDDFVINAEYRLSVNDEWISSEFSYAPKDNKLYVLSDSIKSENEVINSSKVLNYNQYPDVGSVVNLYQYQRSLFDGEEITRLFPGWKENGRMVPWMYTAEVGRHILQPADMVSIDSSYKVKIKNKWLNYDGRVDAAGNVYCSLQTLVRISGINSYTSSGVSHIGTLDVPQYIQAVELEDKLDIDYINIPESVIYVNNDGTNLLIREGFEVAEDNPNYTSYSGVLLDKQETMIIGIPYNMKELTIRSGIKSVNLTESNNLKSLNLGMQDISEMPDINYNYLDKCSITVDENVLDDFILNNYQALANTQCLIATEEQPDVTYKVIRTTVVNNSGKLSRVIKGTGSSVIMSDDIESIGSTAFDDADNVKKLVMPDKSDVIFEKDCLKNSSVETILCSSERQRDSVLSQLDEAGKDNIQVYVMKVSTDGYSYYNVEKDGVKENILVRAPEDITEFNGIIENGLIVINEIDSECFAECRNLVWVTLPEDVTEIGYEAFRNCISLQGVLIETTDTIVIGNRAFEGCEALRFVASNAMNAVMTDGYNPHISDRYETGVDRNDYFFILSGTSGYGSNTDSVSGVSGIERFKLVDAGGSRLLYGADANGQEFVLIRSGSDLSGSIEIPSGIMYINKYAFADAGNKEGFTINWEGLDWLFSIQNGAFINSGLSGDVNISAEQGMLLYDMAFSGCTGITNVSIKGTIYYLGEEVFNTCTSLKNAEFGAFDSWMGVLYAGLFNECNALESIKFNNYEPPQLVIYGSYGFQFNYAWTKEEEAEHIKLIVPEGTEESYILSWRYIMCGYTGIYYGSPYLDMWSGIQSELIDWDTATLPTNEKVDATVRERLLVTENYIRKMMGYEQIDEPTGYYPMRVTDGLITLIETPSYIENIDFTSDYLGLPDGWFVDYIGSRAFEKAHGLSHVTIADNLVGIYSEAFVNTGGKEGKLTIEFLGDVPVQLIADNNGTFSFGINNVNITIIVPQGTKDAYIDAWSGLISKEQLNQMIIERENTEE